MNLLPVRFLPAARTTAWNSGSSCGCWACRGRRAAGAPVCSPPWRWPTPGATLGSARHPPTRATASTCECPRNFPFFCHFDSACAIRLVIHLTKFNIRRASHDSFFFLFLSVFSYQTRLTRENLEDLPFFFCLSASEDFATGRAGRKLHFRCFANFLEFRTVTIDRWNFSPRNLEFRPFDVERNLLVLDGARCTTSGHFWINELSIR